MARGPHYPTTMYYPDGRSKTIQTPDEWEEGTSDTPFSALPAGGERVIGQPETHTVSSAAPTHVAVVVEKPKVKK